MAKGKLRLEPEVRAMAVEVNTEFKRMVRLIPKARTHALGFALLKVVDNIINKEGTSAEDKGREQETVGAEKVDKGPFSAAEALNNDLSAEAD